MMSIYATLIGAIAGICFGYSILYLFVGLRRSEDKRLNLTFALFALGYAGTLLLGIWYRDQTTAADFLAISRWDGIFIWLAFVSLNWYVATYTNVGGKLYLWGFTAIFTIVILGAMLTPTLTFTVMPALAMIPLPWNEEIPTLIGEENIWGVLLLLGQMLTLAFIIFAGLRQWLRGERQAASVLLGGMAWFMIALFYEILAEAGLFAYIPLAESGFLGIAIALSLQMANSVIKTEESLAASEKYLETIVTERTARLAETQAKLIEQTRESAVFDERQRIARDLHDAVSQTIYSASLIAEVLPQVWERNPDEGQRNLTKLRQLVRGALAEMRTLLFELRPSALENADLETLLPQLADAFTGRTQIPVEVTVSGNHSIPAEVKVAFYRITQEAFNNISKHASATEVMLTCEQQPDAVRLLITDNGRGFDTAARPTEQMGLAIMQERASAIKAQFELSSQPGAGTQLVLCWQAENRIKGELSSD